MNGALYRTVSEDTLEEDRDEVRRDVGNSKEENVHHRRGSHHAVYKHLERYYGVLPGVILIYHEEYHRYAESTEETDDGGAILGIFGTTVV